VNIDKDTYRFRSPIFLRYGYQSDALVAIPETKKLGRLALIIYLSNNPAQGERFPHATPDYSPSLD
jgi:hypothetical protein